jgi:hypothetical protein
MTGLVVAGIALVAGVTCFAEVVAATAGPLQESLSAAARRCPLDDSIGMRQGRYAVYELTGSQGGAGPITVTSNAGPRLTAQDVQVSGPAGRPVEAEPLEAWHSETLTRGSQIFTAVAYLQIPAAGPYRVRITAAPGATVVIAPAFGLGGVVGWIVGGVLSGVALVLGLVLVLVGVVRARRPVVGPALAGPPLAEPPPGWYPDPGAPDRLRYWDGHAWTPPSS